MTPTRIELRRTKGYRRPEGTIQVDRVTIFGNPWQMGNPGKWLWPRSDKAGWVYENRCNGPVDAAFAVTWFTRWLEADVLPWMPVSLTELGRDNLRADMDNRRAWILSRLSSLRGHHLGCRCPLDQPCHADVLLRMANA